MAKRKAKKRPLLKIEREGLSVQKIRKLRGPIKSKAEVKRKKIRPENFVGTQANRPYDNPLDFTMSAESIEYRNSIDILADMFGIENADIRAEREAREEREEREERLAEYYENAKKFRKKAPIDIENLNIDKI